MHRNIKLKIFLESLYIPVDLKSNFYQLLKLIEENEYRGIQEGDDNHIFVNALIINTSGRGAFETYKGYEIIRIDVGEVRDTYSDIAIVYPDRIKPMRIKKDNIRINLPE